MESDAEIKIHPGDRIQRQPESGRMGLSGNANHEYTKTCVSTMGSGGRLTGWTENMINHHREVINLRCRYWRGVVV